MTPRKKLLFAAAMLLIPVVFLELSARVYWKIGGGVPFSAPHRIQGAFYPELQPLLESRKNDDVFEILLLGGSVLDSLGRPFQAVLNRQLQFETRIHNVSVPGHTTRDSYFKYKSLKERKFDLVVFYHGINDVRANYVPPETFDVNYSHYHWYNVLNHLDRHSETSWLLAPVTLHKLFLDFRERLASGATYAREMPSPESLPFGKQIKTVKSFEHNLGKLIELARQKNEPVLLMTFAYQTPHDYPERYSEARYREIFDAFNRDRDETCCPIEIWGKPRYVLDGMAAHNEVIRRVALDNPEVLFLDQDGRMSNQQPWFEDVCHLTGAGMQAFLRDVWPMVKESREPTEAGAD